jgi:hypothetical protein
MIDLAVDSRVFINTPLEEAVQELDMIFNTERTELIGYPDYGTNFEQFLWSLNPDSNQLRTYILEQINVNSLFIPQMNVEVDVQVIEGDYRNIYLVSITMSDDYGNVEKRAYEFK